VWRIMPETKGLSLEQIGEFWRARDATRRHASAEQL
jgi:hypothetical protein